MKHLSSFLEKNTEKVDNLKDCPSFGDFDIKIQELKSIVKKIKSEMKGGTYDEIDDYIEYKIFGRDI
jgi:hypothetical protein